jgi:hypothetical protein
MGFWEDASQVPVFKRDWSSQGLQPRIVFALLLLGAAAGIWVAHWGESVPTLVSWWFLVVSLGSLSGGLYWRLVLFETTDFESSDGARSVINRWRQVATSAILGFILGGLGSVGGEIAGQSPDIGVLLIGLGILFVPLLWLALYRVTDTEHTTIVAYLRWSLFVVTLVSLVGFAWTETSGRVLDWGVRLGHIGVFALWIGGATWHNFVVLPTVRTSPSVAGGIKSQARRFRRHLPIVIVVVFGTGIFQTIRLLGYSVSALFGTSLGRLITVKIGILLVLTTLVAINFRQARHSDHPHG